MVYSAALSWQINFAFSVQVIFKDLHNLKRILKEIGLCANRDIPSMSSCLPVAESDVVDDGELVELGSALLLMEAD